MWVSFAINSGALVLSVVMLLKWQGVYTAIDEGTTIPTLTIIYAMGNRFLQAIYTFALLLCLIISSSTAIFGFVEKFERAKVLGSIKSRTIRSAITAAFVIVFSMMIATFGLTDIIKYGYGYCGYFAIVSIIIPFLTIGHIKNKKYAEKNCNQEK